MAAFKDLYDEALVRRMAEAIGGVVPFDRDGFLGDVLPVLGELELKGRVAAIADGVVARAGVGFEELVEALIGLLAPARPWQDGVTWSEDDGGGPGSRGMAVWRGMAAWPWVAIVERHGLDHVDASLDAMERMTSRMSAEFAVRPFLVHHRARTMAAVEAWARSEDEHVRRLASEGTRPRLPWGIRLDHLVDDPTPMLPVLVALRDDPSEYVRRSVANHLNDISKDHPSLANDVAADWLADATPERERLVRHALRTLVKKGDPQTLRVLGYEPNAPVRLDGLRGDAEVAVGGALAFEFTLVSEAHDRALPLVVDYVVHHVRANGSRSPKVFKLATVELAAGQKRRFRRKHSFRVVTTRRYYPGQHRVDVVVNGTTLGGFEFALHG